MYQVGPSSRRLVKKRVGSYPPVQTKPAPVPGTPKDLRDQLGFTGPTLSFHLNKLRKAEIVREEPDGRTKRLYVVEPERVANVLVTYRRSFLDSAVDRFAESWLALGPPNVRPAADEGRYTVERVIAGPPPSAAAAR